MWRRRVCRLLHADSRRQFRRLSASNADSRGEFWRGALAPIHWRLCSVHADARGKTRPSGRWRRRCCLLLRLVGIVLGRRTGRSGLNRCRRPIMLLLLLLLLLLLNHGSTTYVHALWQVCNDWRRLHRRRRPRRRVYWRGRGPLGLDVLLMSRQ
jgi:hypothetical protein